MARKSAATVEKAIEVAILWIPSYAEVDENGDCTISALNGHGGLRCYEKDKYDSRVDLGRDREKDGPIPFFAKFSEAFDYMKANKGQQVQVPYALARQIF